MDILALFVAAFLQLASLSLDQLRQTIDAIATALAEQYVDASEGKRLGDLLAHEFEHGGFSDSGEPEVFAAAAQRSLQAASKDRHLLLWHGTPADILKMAPGDRLQGPSIGRTELRSDGIGYVEVRHFLSELQGNPESSAQIDGAMRSVAGAKALILDLRLNPGGDFPPLARLATYLFAARTHLLSRAIRGQAATRELWTLDDIPGPRRPDIPVYVLTSADTFSAGEAFAFALQKAERAVIVGERTGGGGHSGTLLRLPNGFSMFMPTGRTFDPRTGDGWQTQGVLPDREAPAADALDVAIGLATHK